MDHSAHMHHSMSMPDHGGHGGHDMPHMPNCKMNMIWNTDIIDTCIVFRSWHISSNAIFLVSCFVIVLLGILHEYIRIFQRKLDYHIAVSLQAKSGKQRRSRSNDRSGSQSPTGGASFEETGLLSGTIPIRLLSVSSTGTRVPVLLRLTRAIFYGASVFLSFFLMLVFMTYNAYLILAVILGAVIGHYIFNSTINIDTLNNPDAQKGMACH